MNSMFWSFSTKCLEVCSLGQVYVIRRETELCVILHIAPIQRNWRKYLKKKKKDCVCGGVSLESLTYSLLLFCNLSLALHTVTVKMRDLGVC